MKRNEENRYPPTSASDDLNELPRDLIKMLAEDSAFSVDELKTDQFESYLEGLDEGYLKELLVKVGSNGKTSLRLFAVKPSANERIGLPLSRMFKDIGELLKIDISNLPSNVKARSLAPRK
jgi:hypothetical protein